MTMGFGSGDMLGLDVVGIFVDTESKHASIALGDPASYEAQQAMKGALEKGFITHLMKLSRLIGGAVGAPRRNGARPVGSAGDS